MRYYEVQITPPRSNKPSFAWGSHPGGVFDPGALNVRFDMPVLPFDTPSGGQTVTIEGVSLEAISQAHDFVGANIVIKGGMQKGLPLANPLQSGVLVAGQILQSFGNWEGTEQTLNLVVYPQVFTMDNPGNIVLDWKPGQKLADCLRQTFRIAYPGMPLKINIGDNLVTDAHLPVPFSTLEGLALWIGNWSESYFSGQRVSITIQGSAIVVYDRTYKPGPIQINFTDLIGQPTWVDTNLMQMKTVMRADLQIGSIITMPRGMQSKPGFVVTRTQSSPAQLRYESAFQNNFLVKEVRHIGDFRSGDSADWCSVFSCIGGA